MSVENTGPLPGGGSGDRPALSRPRSAVLRALQEQSGPVTAAALAQVCRLHVNTAREHLDALVGLGLAVREQAPATGRGRPARLYRACPPQQSAAREYAGLAAVLAVQIARSSVDPQADALAAGEEWGRALVAGRQPARSPRKAREQVTALLADIGFAPETDSEADGVRLLRCPFIEVAREHPGVICSVHAGLVKAALAALGGGDPDHVTLHPFATTDACLLRFRAAPQASPRRDRRTNP